MANFSIAVALTLQHEGGYVDNPADPGGATNMGITQYDMPGQDIKTLNVAQATAYYLEHYWKPFYSQISNQAIASKLFDLGVLFGVGTAVKVLQGVLSLVQDGNFGPVSLSAVNAAGSGLLSGYKNALSQHAVNVVASNPREAMFLAGWQRRINS
jgi:lysozyme family protein